LVRVLKRNVDGRVVCSTTGTEMSQTMGLTGRGKEDGAGVQEAKGLGGWQRPEGVSRKLEVLVGGEGWLWRPQALLQYLDL
jgi:hypothetical protein